MRARMFLASDYATATRRINKQRIHLPITSRPLFIIFDPQRPGEEGQANNARPNKNRGWLIDRSTPNLAISLLLDSECLITTYTTFVILIF